MSGVPVMAPSQLSVAVGAVGRFAEHWAVTSGKLGAFGTGAVVSFTMTVALHVLEAPWLSVTVRVTDVLPSE